MVETSVQHNEVGSLLQSLEALTLLNDLPQTLQNTNCLHRILKLDSHALLRRIEYRIEKMPLQLPSNAGSQNCASRKVERRLLSERPVELAPKWVQQQVHLVEQENPGLENFQSLRTVESFSQRDLGEMFRDSLLDLFRHKTQSAHHLAADARRSFLLVSTFFLVLQVPVAEKIFL